MDNNEKPNATTTNQKLKQWFKRIGLMGFTFFLIKGLLWLIIPYLITKGCINN
ncbi:MAG: hypothetical protein H3C45_05950 [Bacteroidia bacterium]|nr:hypothetical protein [Bacteroidia bacterium]MCC7533602.1 hypothetical protein [Bacteroidia bacterium]MCZ2140443.1 hypothetical protein [Bacteroidia bacterium]